METGTRRSPAWTVRLAVWSASHPRALVAAWLVATIGLFALTSALGGMRTSGPTNGTARTEAARAASAMRAGADSATSESLDVVVTATSARAGDPAFRAATDHVLARLRGATVTLDAAAGPAAAGLADPFAAPAGSGAISPDGTSVHIAGHLDGTSADRQARARAVATALGEVRAELPGYEIHALSESLLLDQITTEINLDLDTSLWISLPATFLILLVAFGALVAAGVPLLLAVTALLGAFGLLAVFSHLVSPVSEYATQLIVLIGLAVAIDYSLFVITRFRTERRAGRAKPAAIEIASATSGRAVVFSGLAVMVSLAALFLLPDPMFQSMAVGTIAVIAVSVAGSLVFLPALLALLGDGVDRGRIPLLARRSERFSPWTRLVASVTRRPVLATVLAAAALLALASPVARLRLGESDLSAFPERVDGIAAARALQEHWPQGALLRLDVVVTRPAEPARAAAIPRLETELLNVPGLTGPARLATAADGSATSVSLLMSGSQNAESNWQIVRRVRAEIVPALFGPEAGRVYVGGGAAASLDQSQVYSDGIVRIVAFVLGFSFVLLLLVFRSIAIPLKAILLNLLASGAAFGSMVLVFQEGWFGAQLGVTTADSIQNFVPVFVFTALFGLSMDYEVFILARVREAVDAGQTSRQAVAEGIGRTAGTVTSAAAIMVVVFAVFLTLPLPITRELGLGLLVAVFVDATIVRSVLLPATMHLLGDWNWWLPRWLGWLPRIAVEGEAPAMPDAPAAVSGGTAAAFR